jgi:hypothetical protein
MYQEQYMGTEQASSQNALAERLRAQGKYSEAEPLY